MIFYVIPVPSLCFVCSVFLPCSRSSSPMWPFNAMSCAQSDQTKLLLGQMEVRRSGQNVTCDIRMLWLHIFLRDNFQFESMFITIFDYRPVSTLHVFFCTLNLNCNTIFTSNTMMQDVQRIAWWGDNMITWVPMPFRRKGHQTLGSLMQQRSGRRCLAAGSWYRNSWSSRNSQGDRY